VARLAAAQAALDDEATAKTSPAKKVVKKAKK
jgi:hypothetical protein